MPDLDPHAARHDEPIRARGRRLVAVADLPHTNVAEVDTDEHGVIAVGMRRGEPFAVSNVCRHQFGKLGRGRVTEDGCLECPWHRSRYDVATGAMVEGPKGRIFGFAPYSAAVKAVNNAAVKLTRYEVELRDGAIWLR